VTWISYEPALGPLTLANFPVWPRWVIFGGESGARRRPCEAKWAEGLLREIQEFNPAVAFFMKQMSARTPAEAKALIPGHLLVREYPQ